MCVMVGSIGGGGSSGFESRARGSGSVKPPPLPMPKPRVAGPTAEELAAAAAFKAAQVWVQFQSGSDMNDRANVFWCFISKAIIRFSTPTFPA